jgi:hypothetical protein
MGLAWKAIQEDTLGPFQSLTTARTESMEKWGQMEEVIFYKPTAALLVSIPTKQSCGEGSVNYRKVALQ